MNIKQKKLDSKNQKIFDRVIGDLDKIAEERKNWQVDHDRTNARLYELLACCLELYHQIKGQPIESAVVGAMKRQLELYGLSGTARTTVLTLIVRYIFVTKQKRAFVYSRALALAVNSKITPMQFGQWVSDAGGIDEVVAQGAKPETLAKKMLVQNKKVEVRKYLAKVSSQPFAIVKPDLFIKEAGQREYTILLATTDANGTSKVLCSVPNTTAAMIETCVTKVAEAVINTNINLDTKLTSRSFEFYDIHDAANDTFCDESALSKFVDCSDYSN